MIKIQKTFIMLESKDYPNTLSKIYHPKMKAKKTLKSN